MSGLFYEFDKIESNRKKHIYSNIRIVSNKQNYKYCWRLVDITIFDDVSICSFSRYLVAGRYLQKDMIAYQYHIKPIILSFPTRERTMAGV